MAQRITLRERALSHVLKHMKTHVNAHGQIGPDFLIGPEDDPQTRRWYLTPLWLRPVFAIYAHEWRRSDADAPHDHPYLFNVSWILSIGYYEGVFSRMAIRLKHAGVLPDYREDMDTFWRPAGSVIWHWGWTAHRVQLKTFRAIQMQGQSFVMSEGMDAKGSIPMTPQPITLFFILFRGVRTWGFHCPHRWKPYFEYVSPHSYGNQVGKGCEE